MDQGILVGANQKQEYLLPWWWEHFSKCNTYPVAFADFGMSAKAQAWCKEKGALITIPKAPIAEPMLIDKNLADSWKKRWKERGEEENLWELRKVWFKKPLAHSFSPFERTLWLDLDCEVRKNLQPLFDIPLTPSKFAIMPSGSTLCAQVAKEGKTETQEILHYNSGVILFERHSSLLDLWIRALEQGSQVAQTEEDLLSLLISIFQIEVTPLPTGYNWEILRLGSNPDASIYHWMGERGKKAILSHFPPQAL